MTLSVRRRRSHRDPHAGHPGMSVGSLLPLALLAGGFATDDDDELPTRH